jgi:hypothetical protein
LISKGLCTYTEFLDMSPATAMYILKEYMAQQKRIKDLQEKYEEEEDRAPIQGGRRIDELRREMEERSRAANERIRTQQART